ncbi:hypothetical protein CYMTET_13880 [Cymbomonas tetramitiformis]|uniref:CobQ/CobB/MinD/ParA nucleotide binding domain-containing protein n=1 Tax=Cymbomonas tetramitiformis TaxID=36881 RepID=A0AAE0GH67_9CHLO|nr:hypothetical protein CYMTET_13880 [Cymbomonas tetramitiformis]
MANHPRKRPRTEPDVDDCDSSMLNQGVGAAALASLAGKVQSVPLLIAVYSFKGGCGKTTLSINLGATLAKYGHRTLLADLDPQGNLSTFFSPAQSNEEEGIDEEGDGEIEIDLTREEEEELDSGNFITNTPLFPEVEELTTAMAGELNFKERDSGNRIISSVYSEGSPLWDLFREEKRKADFKCEIVQLCNMEGITDLPTDLFLLPGNPALCEVEDELAKTNSDKPANFYKLCSIRKMLLETAKANDIDFVLVDCGPSSSALNRTIVLSCDYLLPPCMADSFSSSSVYRLLKKVLPQWMQAHRLYMRNKDDLLNDEGYGDQMKRICEEGFMFPQDPPQILPFLVMNFSMGNHRGYTDASGKKLKEMVAKSDSAFSMLVDTITYAPEIQKKNIVFKPAKIRAVGQLEPKDSRSISFLKKIKEAVTVGHEMGQPPVLITHELVRNLSCELGESNSEVEKKYKTLFAEVTYAKEKFRSLASFIVNLRECN